MLIKKANLCSGIVQSLCKKGLKVKSYPFGETLIRLSETSHLYYTDKTVPCICVRRQLHIL